MASSYTQNDFQWQWYLLLDVSLNILVHQPFRDGNFTLKNDINTRFSEKLFTNIWEICCQFHSKIRVK